MKTIRALMQFAEPGNRQGETPSKPVDRHRFLKLVTGALAIFFLLYSGVAPLRTTAQKIAPPSCAGSSTSRSTGFKN